MSEENKRPSSFSVQLKNLLPVDYTTTDKEAFEFGVGQAGELMIFRTEYHETFDAVTAKHVRIKCYAPGTWLEVEVQDDDTE